jgi:hypothetical protein
MSEARDPITWLFYAWSVVRNMVQFLLSPG